MIFSSAFFGLSSALPQTAATGPTDPVCAGFLAWESFPMNQACPNLNLYSSSPNTAVLCTPSCKAFLVPFIPKAQSACKNDAPTEQKLSLLGTALTACDAASTSGSAADPQCQAYLAANALQGQAACPGFDPSSSSPDYSKICQPTCSAFLGPFAKNGQSQCQNSPSTAQKLALLSTAIAACPGNANATATTTAQSATNTPKGNSFRATASASIFLICASLFV
ncbi:hypothetical protein HDV01_002191 [Terramyces sp. JEL0728]|nr:hypothetical protein HDV01_002191 [Terramyces sp. JEL0728]